jgi:hypothetical protein
MTRFADNIGRIRIIDIDRTRSDGPYKNLGCTRAFMCERFSRPAIFGAVSIGFQSFLRLLVVVRIDPPGSYVFDRGYASTAIATGPAPLA